MRLGYYDGDCLLDAEKVTAWFRRRFGRQLPPSLERRSRDWRQAGYAALASVERYLVDNDATIHSLPDDAWLDSKESTCPRCDEPVGLQNYGQMHSRYCPRCHDAMRQRKVRR